MLRLKVAEPTTEECGGKIRRVNLGNGRVILDEVNTWRGRLSGDEARRLTVDHRHMQRLARRRLARRRKYMLERRRLLNQRRTTALLQWDADGDGWFTPADLRSMLTELVPGAPPSDADVVALMERCALRDAGRSPRVHPTTADAAPSRLTSAEALRALCKFELAVADTASLASLGSTASVISSIDDLSDFEELLAEERLAKHTPRPAPIAEGDADGDGVGAPEAADSFIAAVPNGAGGMQSAPRARKGMATACVVS